MNVRRFGSAPADTEDVSIIPSIPGAGEPAAQSQASADPNEYAGIFGCRE